MASEGVVLNEEGEGIVMLSRSSSYSSYDDELQKLWVDIEMGSPRCEILRGIAASPAEDELNDISLEHDSLATNQEYCSDLSGQVGYQNIKLDDSERPAAKKFKVSLKVATMDTLGGTGEVDSPETPSKPKRAGSKSGRPRGAYNCGECGKPKLDEHGRSHFCEVLAVRIEKCKVDASTNTTCMPHLKVPYADLKSTSASNKVWVTFSNPYSPIFDEHSPATVTDEHSDLIAGAFEDPECNDQDVDTVSLNLGICHQPHR
jgi:hypothetical protein